MLSTEAIPSSKTEERLWASTLLAILGYAYYVHDLKLEDERSVFISRHREDKSIIMDAEKEMQDLAKEALSFLSGRASNLFRLDPAMNYQVIISLFHPFPRVQKRSGPDNISSSRWRSPVGSSAQEKKSIVRCWSTSRPSATPKLLKAHTLALVEKQRQRQTEHRPESLGMLAKI
jgi:hypothetical protein